MTPKEVHALVMAFPGVVEGASYGHPAYKVAGKFFTRLRAEDASVVLQEVGFDEREMLTQAAPQAFHFTEHYRNYPIVLARIAAIQADELRGFLEPRWRKIAPKAAVKAWDAARAGGA